MRAHGCVSAAAGCSYRPICPPKPYRWCPPTPTIFLLPRSTERVRILGTIRVPRRLSLFSPRRAGEHGVDFPGIRSVPEGLSPPRPAGRRDAVFRSDSLRRSSLSSLRAVLASTAWIFLRGPGSDGTAPKPACCSQKTPTAMRPAPWGLRWRRCFGCQTSPWWSIASATFTKPAMLAPLT